MKKDTLVLFILVLNGSFISYPRSVHRPPDPKMPQITAQWEGESGEKYTLKDSHIEEYPIFKIRAEDSYRYFLPNDKISYRNNPEQSVETEKLKKLIEGLLVEIQEGKSSYTHFTVIHRSDFNRKKKCGLLIAKFNDYPFIVKLSMERPNTFINPYCKGFVPRFFFYMSGGTGRHMTGLTRIANLEKVNEKIKNHPIWSSYVQTPRKWFWLPENTRWIQITGKNIGHSKTITTKLPSVYGVIADAMDMKEDFKISKTERNRIAMHLCNDVDLFIDPHKNNFAFKTNQETQALSIAVIDTEHFPTIVGIKQKESFRNHLDWYIRLSQKCLHDMYFRTKKERHETQFEYSELALF